MTPRFARVLAFAVALALPLLASADPKTGEADTSAGTAPPRGAPVVPAPVPPVEEIRSIPYPNGAMYVTHGLTGSFMGGKHRNYGEEQALFQWQGEIGYFYTSWFSGGLGFKITAGEPSDTAQKIFNRYFIITRLHKRWNKIALYMDGQLGLGNLNILTGSVQDTKIETPIENTKPTLSLDFGGGWKFSRWVGFTAASNWEYSLVTEEGVGTKNALNHHLNPGLAIDLLSFSETLKQVVPAMYVNLEYQLGFLFLEKRRLREDQAEVIGISLAF